MNFTALLASLKPWLPFVIVFVVSLIIAFFLKKWLRWQLGHLPFSQKLRDRLVNKLNAPAILLLLGLAATISLGFAPETLKYHKITVLGLRIYFVLVSLVALERLNQVVFSRDGYFSRLTSGTRQLIRITVRIFVYSIGALIVFEILGISITPILASLGVGSLAVALALQDTFSNFFSGVYMLVDRLINVGDFIRVDNGTTVEGYVDQIGWRTTKVREITGHIVTLPNSKIASARVTNFNMPTSESTISVNFTVSSELDLEKVENTALDAAKEVARQNSAIAGSHSPRVEFSGFADTRVNLVVNVSARTFGDTFRLKHELVKMLNSRFKSI